MTANRVDVDRGGELESRHRFHAVVADHAEGEEVRFGDATILSFWRSSMKPFQALPLVEDGVVDQLPLAPEELALCCASHAGRVGHVEGVEGILARLGLDEEALGCGPGSPLDREASRRVLRDGGEYRRVHHNCSGKHAGMLALALHHGWPGEGYVEEDHPVQRRIRESLGEWLDVDPGTLAWGVDGCGVPTPRLSLRQMARAYGRLGRAARDGRPGPRGVVTAMTEHPDRVSGDGRPVTRIMDVTGGRVLAKEGAEGVLCMAGLSGGWGLALKVSDGARRAATPAALAVLVEMGELSDRERDELDDLLHPQIRNSRDEVVGDIRAHAEGRAVAAAP